MINACSLPSMDYAEFHDWISGLWGLADTRKRKRTLFTSHGLVKRLLERFPEMGRFLHVDYRASIPELPKITVLFFSEQQPGNCLRLCFAGIRLRLEFSYEICYLTAERPVYSRFLGEKRLEEEQLIDLLRDLGLLMLIRSLFAFIVCRSPLDAYMYEGKQRCVDGVRRMILW